MHFRFDTGPFSIRYGKPPIPQILLVRHGQSETNVDRKKHLTIADPMVKLTETGCKQAFSAGSALMTGFLTNAALHGQKVRMYSSDYTRAIQTGDIIEQALIGDASILPKQALADYSRRIDGRIRELEFGILNGMSQEEIARDYPTYKMNDDLLYHQGCKFYARRLGGESPADVENRVRDFFGAIYRDQEKHGINVFIVVCHGLTWRVFTKAWMKYDLAWYDQEKNPKNCSIRWLDGKTDRKYIHGEPEED